MTTLSSINLSALRTAAQLEGSPPDADGTAAGNWDAGFDLHALGNPGAADLLGVQLFLTAQGISAASVSSATRQLREALEAAIRGIDARS